MSVDAAVALISAADLKTFLKITGTSEDAIVEMMVNRSSQLAARYCARNFIAADYVEYYNGNGRAEMITKNYPIVSVASIYVDANREFASITQVDANDILLDKPAGIIRLFPTHGSVGSFTRGWANVKISYNAGYGTIPYDVQEAVTLIAMYSYKRHYQDQRIGLQSETIGDRNMTYTNEDIPKKAKMILDRFKLAANPDYAY
jgi:uncharacterized phiE125 gp8 family phage protein